MTMSYKSSFTKIMNYELKSNPPDTRRQTVYILATGTLVLVAFLVSLTVGRFPMTIEEIVAIIFGGDVSEMTANVFFNLRFPRTVMALIAGAGLGLTGSVFQSIFKNPLAAPDIVGVTSGANLGAALSIILIGQVAAITTTFAFVGGMLALLLVVAMAKISRNPNTVTIILCGIVMKAISDALIMILKFFADPERELAAIEFWAMGSLATITASKLTATLPFFFFGFIGLILMRRQIKMLSLEDDESKTLGVRLKPVRTAILGLAALTVASIISQTGLIAFAGLIAPHAARLALKKTNFTWCVLSAMMGALILLVSDTIARSISTVEIPISIPTTLIGVPILLYFMWSRKAGKV
jgi:iron complex transport system permease protein